MELNIAVVNHGAKATMLKTHTPSGISVVYHSLPYDESVIKKVHEKYNLVAIQPLNPDTMNEEFINQISKKFKITAISKPDVYKSEELSSTNTRKLHGKGVADLVAGFVNSVEQKSLKSSNEYMKAITLSLAEKSNIVKTKNGSPISKLMGSFLDHFSKKPKKSLNMTLEDKLNTQPIGGTNNVR